MVDQYLNHYEGEVTTTKDGAIVGNGRGTMMNDKESIHGEWKNGKL